MDDDDDDYGDCDDNADAMASSIFNRLLGESPALLKTHLHHQPSPKTNIIVLKMEIGNGKPVIGEV